ncbi:ABC transporter ATP-binding protein [Lentibacillus salinarum]|uniref:ABC transporter ATP-binding protein n=1 Tax=Lentibacillus salinarum TaxID=446820 RepID=A0ABW3ZSN0_9BACI
MQACAEFSQVKKQIDDFHMGPVDLAIEPGTITALVGSNGSGKSTLLKLMMDLTNADSGVIHIFDTPVDTNNESWKRHVAYLPQAHIGYHPYTGQDLKEMIAPMYPDWDDNLFAEIVGTFHLPLNKKYGKLSQGMQQKLSLALTIPRNAPLLLLDEPTAFMDIPSKRMLMDLLTDWVDQGERAIVMTSHQAENIMKLADYLCVLQDGKQIGTFEKEELLQRYRKYWVSSSLPEEAVPGEIAREGQAILSDQPEATETFFRDSDLAITHQTALDLEEILSYLLKQP